VVSISKTPALTKAELTKRLANVDVKWNLKPPEYYEQVVLNDEGIITADGAVRILTGEYTGRSPKDKFFVRDDQTNQTIWWGEINQPITPEAFDRLYEKVLDHISQRPKVYAADFWAGSERDFRLPIRLITEAAYHGLFARNMFLVPTGNMPEDEPHLTILAAPGLHANPEEDGTRTSTFIVLNLQKGIILIGGTLYSGEVKKGVFTVLNYLLPQIGILPMHCSANVGEADDVALFFGLSGTGKTTLSTDSSRILVGDDEHGWSDNGVFNFEGGCYAKTINITPDSEPEIYATTRMFGSILENVPIDDDRNPVYDDTTYTENTRVSYPLSYIPNTSSTRYAGHPNNVIFLTADAFGVLPPVSKLTVH